MKKKRLLILVLQMVIVAGFGFGFYTYTQSEIEPTEVFVFVNNVNELDRPITEDDIRKVSIPGKAVNNTFAKKATDIIGKHVSTDVYSGQYVYTKTLIDYDKVDTFDVIDTSNLRKISLPINFVEGFSGNIKRGDRIDLTYTGDGEKIDESNTGRPSVFLYSKIFMQDILVYSVNTSKGTKFTDVSGAADVGSGKEEITTESNSAELAVITLAVTPDQAEEIRARSEAGKIGYLGRFNDSENRNTLGYVVGDYEKLFTGHGNAESGFVEIEEDYLIEDLEPVESEDPEN